MPTKTREPSGLQWGVVYSLRTYPAGKSEALDGSYVVSLPAVAVSPVHASSTFDRWRYPFGLGAAEDRQVGALVAPGQTVEFLGRHVERPGGAAGEVQQVGAIPQVVHRVDGVGEHVAGVVEVVLGDVPDVARHARGHLPHQKVRAVVRRVLARLLVHVHRHVLRSL